MAFAVLHYPEKDASREVFLATVDALLSQLAGQRPEVGYPDSSTLRIEARTVDDLVEVTASVEDR